MTLTELRYIVAVAREGHFGQAAKACFVSQPTLSLGIKKLEDELGVNLFERNHKELVVTPLGRRIVAQAQRILSDVEHIKDMVKQNQDPLKTPLRLGAIHTVGPYLFPSLLPAMRDLAPSLPLVIEENDTVKLLQRLDQGELDAAIVSLPCRETGMAVQALYEEPLVILLPTAHPLTMHDTVAISQLRHETLLLLGHGHCFRKQIMLLHAEFQAHVVEGGSLETIRHMVASGLGITILPATAACADKYSQRLVTIRRLRGDTPKRQIALIWRRNFPRPEAVARIGDAVRLCGLTGVTMLSGGEENIHCLLQPRPGENSASIPALHRARV